MAGRRQLKLFRRNQPAIRCRIQLETSGDIETPGVIERNVGEIEFCARTRDPALRDPDRQVHIAAAGQEARRLIPLQSGPAREIDVIGRDDEVPTSLLLRHRIQLGRRNTHLLTQVFGQAECCIQREAFAVNIHPQALYVEKPRSLVTWLQEDHFDVLADDLHLRRCALALFSEQQPILRRRTLEPPAAVRELPDFDAGIPDDDTINDAFALEQQSRKGNTDAHFLGCHDALLGIYSNQLGVIKRQFRPTQAPSRIHAGELDLHTDSGTGPALDAFLVLRQSRQKQPKQADGDRQQNNDAGRRVGEKLEHASQESSHIG